MGRSRGLRTVLKYKKSSHDGWYWDEDSKSWKKERKETVDLDVDTEATEPDGKDKDGKDDKDDPDKDNGGMPKAVITAEPQQGLVS